MHKLSINIFNSLDKIRERNNITADAWAKASDLQAVRISEWRGSKRNFSTGSLNKLIIGLNQTIGIKMTKREMITELQRLKTDADVPAEDINHLIIALLGSSCNKEILPILETYLYKN